MVGEESAAAVAAAGAGAGGGGGGGGGFAVRQSEVCACRSSSRGVDIKEERLHARGSETLGVLPRRPGRGHTDGQRHKALGINFSAGAQNFGT